VTFLVLGLPAGVWVDRGRRRPILITYDLVRALALMTVPMAWLLGALTLWHLYMVALLLGIDRVLFDVAHTSYLPRVVERRHLIKGNAKLYMSQAAGQVGGPGLVGALLKFIHAPFVLIGDVLSFLLSAWFLARIDVVKPKAAGRQRQWVTGLIADIKQGLGWVLTHPLLGALTTCFYGVRVVGMSASAVATVLAIGATGFIAGTLLAPPAFSRLGLGRAAIAAAALGSAGQLLMPSLMVHGAHLYWRSHGLSPGSVRRSMGSPSLAFVRASHRITCRVDKTPRRVSWCGAQCAWAHWLWGA
jgi:hypothetical protein